MPDIKQLLDLSPPLLLIAGINFIIWVTKFSFPNFPKNKIPLLCLFIGAIAFPLISDPGKVPYTMRAPIISQVVMGLILGGCSVGLHQVFIKQLKEKFGIKLEGETEIIVKTTENAKIEIK